MTGAKHVQVDLDVAAMVEHLAIPGMRDAGASSLDLSFFNMINVATGRLTAIRGVLSVIKTNSELDADARDAATAAGILVEEVNGLVNLMFSTFNAETKQQRAA